MVSSTNYSEVSFVTIDRRCPSYEDFLPVHTLKAVRQEHKRKRCQPLRWKNPEFVRKLALSLSSTAK